MVQPLALRRLPRLRAPATVPSRAGKGAAMPEPMAAMPVKAIHCGFCSYDVKFLPGCGKFATNWRIT
jgi:hypothetical protein